MKANSLLLLLLVLLLVVSAACTRRIAPFSPHRTDSEAHRNAKSNQDCSECHDVVKVGREHRTDDNCLRCHRIVQGD